MMWHLQDAWKCSGHCHGITKEEIFVGRLIAKVQSVRIASVEQMVDKASMPGSCKYSEKGRA